MENKLTTAITTYEDEIDTLLLKMTLREKLGQLVMIEPCFCLDEINRDDSVETYSSIVDPAFLDKLLNKYHIGLFLFGGASTIGDGSPEAWSNYINEVNAFVEQTRLKLPLLYASDAVHGVNFIKEATIYSHNLGMTATWNPTLVKSYATKVGAELTSLGFNCNFAPTIDVARDQRWGRVYESLGEDAYLASVMSKALVEGMQANGRVAATAKHFIGYGESGNGMDRTPADLSDRSIIENHIPPFEAAIEAGIQSIMINGGDVNGVPMPASKKLMTHLLRERMGFKGVTMSDWEDVYRLLSRHKIVKDRKEGIAKAFNAGLDMNMAVADLKAVDIMEELVEEGTISMERVNEAVGNVLRVKFNTGLFNSKSLPNEDVSTLVGDEISKKIAKQIALESLTLLKNDHHTLPLSKNIKSILVTGMRAHTKRHLCGGWTHGWASANEDDLHCKTILDAIKGKVSKNTRVTYISNVESLKQLNISKSDFDICISVVGEEPHSEWLGDSMDMEMELEEVQLLEAVVEIKVPVVMVSIIGRPSQLVWADEHISSILWAYLPGTEGALPIADVLFGDENPSGKTPITFPKNGNQIPIVYNARSYTCHEITTRYEPLYPFGFGLSYTTFEYSNLVVPIQANVGCGIEISVNIKNTGKQKGMEVIQLYLKDSYASVTRPLKSLKAFKKIELLPNEQKTVVFNLEPKALSLYDEDLNLIEEPREIQVIIDNQTEMFRLV